MGQNIGALNTKEESCQEVKVEAPYLNKETFRLLNIDFVEKVTAVDLAAAICVIEAGHKHDSVIGTAGVIYNRLRSNLNFIHNPTKQAGLKNEKLLHLMSSKRYDDSRLHEIQVLDTFANRIKIRDALKGQKKDLTDIWKAEFNRLVKSNGEANPVGTRCYWVNVGSKHNKQHKPIFKGKDGNFYYVRAITHGGCFVFGDLCFRDSYKATDPYED